MSDLQLSFQPLEHSAKSLKPDEHIKIFKIIINFKL